MAQSSGARINTNIASFNALNALNNVNREMGVHQLRLATGKRINSAADDSAGFVISRKMEGRVRALTSALDNVSDAQNILSVAEGGYNTISELLTQMKDKQARFVNGGLGSAEQDAIATEISQLATEVDDIVAQTKFNGKALIDGTFVATVNQSAASSTLVVGDVATAAGTVDSIDVSNARANTTFTLSDQGSGVLRLTRGNDSVSQDITISATAAGTTQTVNFSSLGVSFKLLGTATLGASSAAAAVVAAGSTIGTAAGSSSSFQVGDTNENFSMAFAAFGATTASQDLLGVAAASITRSNVSSLTIDTGINSVLTKIGDIGAKMNRLSVKESNLTTAITNIEASKSRIMDADIAKEQISAVKLQVLQQTATTQLAQANQSPQVFLSLFR